MNWYLSKNTDYWTDFLLIVVSKTCMGTGIRYLFCTIFGIGIGISILSPNIDPKNPELK